MAKVNICYSAPNRLNHRGGEVSKSDIDASLKVDSVAWAVSDGHGSITRCLSSSQQILGLCGASAVNQSAETSSSSSSSVQGLLAYVGELS